jgi:hypothetical protein
LWTLFSLVCCWAVACFHIVTPTNSKLSFIWTAVTINALLLQSNKKIVRGSKVHIEFKTHNNQPKMRKILFVDTLAPCLSLVSVVLKLSAPNFLSTSKVTSIRSCSLLFYGWLLCWYLDGKT